MDLVIGWPEGIYIGLNLLGIAVIAASPEGKTEITAAGTTIVWAIITLPLLYWGGFFS